MSTVVDFETLPELFAGLEERYSGQQRPVLRYKDTTAKNWVDITHEELAERARTLAAFMYQRGVRAGDRIGLLSENRPEWTIVHMAVQLVGAIDVSLYTSLPASQVAYIIQDSGARMLFTSTGIQLKKAERIYESCPELDTVVSMSELRIEHPDWVVHWDKANDEGARMLPELKSSIEEAWKAVRPDDVSSLIYTSGTTGTPKGAMITHRNFATNATASLGLVPIGRNDHHLSFLPLCHVFERTAGYVAVLAAGGLISYAESVTTVNRNLSELSPTILISVPRLFERIYNLVIKSVEEGSPAKKRIFNWAVAVGHQHKVEGKDGPLTRLQYQLAHRLVFSKLHERLGGKLRFAVSGGAALPAAIGEFFLAAGIIIIEGYGLTETAPVLTINPHDSPRFGTVGRVITGVTIGIRDIEKDVVLAQISGEDYPTDLSSEEGEIIARGPNIMKGYWNNDQATAEAIDASGWFRTGDIGRFEDGRLRITDRLKHMIVSKGGKNIYPGPIEDLFKAVPWIDQLVVVGEGREFLSALVVPDNDALEAYAKSNKIAFQSIGELYALDEIQKLYEDEFKSYSRSAAAHEKIRAFRLVDEAFSVELGTMTPTLKPRRKAIEKRYAALIDEIYQSVV